MRLKSFVGLLIFFHCIHAWSINAELIETSVQDPAILNQDEALYVLIRYQSDQPLRFQAIGEYQNQPINKNVRFNPSQPYPEENSEAIAWVAYYKSTQIDQLTVTIYNKNWHRLKKVSLPINIEWLDQNIGAIHTVPAWAQKLNQEQQIYAASSHKTSEVYSSFWGGELFISLLFLSLPLYWILQITVLITWKDNWKKYALIPLWVSVPLLFYTLYALWAGSSLWPLMMIIICPILLILLLMIILYKRWNTNISNEKLT